ncbi:MAG TPA: gliding motility-associated C-terminal domain-containing protein, partial [Bacteroidetes bacterium]|nr:gliding motility-associated C-terminal domain-containing protein [Bacteroidota bacterium]
PAPPTVSISGPASACEGQEVQLVADMGFVSYQWSTGEATASVSVDQPGSYSVTATDANGCTAEASFIFENTPLPGVAITGPASICTGSSGTLAATGNFTQINWNTGATTPNIDVSQPGTYSVVVTDANGCTNEASHVVQTANSLTPVIVATGGNCNGMATLNAGSGYANYLWSNGQTGATITTTTSGTYTVTVSDASGCSGTASVEINISVAPQVGISGPANACEGQPVSLTADPGFTSYTWSNGAVTSAIEVDQPGTYEVVVTDANGCTASTTHDFVVHPSPSANIIGPASTCLGSDAQLSVSGSFAQIVWNTGATTSAITVSQSGTYSVQVTDANGCTASDDHALLIGTSLSPVISLVDVSCDGWAVLDAGGSFASYLWSNGQTGPTLTVNANGEYAVTVSDGTGCTGETVLNVELPEPPFVLIDGPASICTGGTAQLSVPGTFAQAQWSTGAMTPSITVSTGGVYSVTVTDANGCTAEASLVLDVSDSLTPVITPTLADCDGTSVLDVSGTYDTYIWSDGSTNSTLVVNANGSYSVTVTDAGGCTGSAAIDVILPDAPQVHIAGVEYLCEGDQIMLTAPGNFVQYLWNTGATTASITVVQGGIYSVTVSDANGCTATDQWVLTEYATDYTVIVEEACSAQDTGTVQTVLSNQFGCDSVVITQIELAPELTTAVSLTACPDSFAEFNGVPIAAGTTQNFVYNAVNGCDSVVSVSVAAFPFVHFDASVTETCWNDANGAIGVAMQSGTAPFLYSLNGAPMQPDPVFSGLPGGPHAVSVMDANGCQSETIVDVPVRAATQVQIEVPELNCEDTLVMIYPTVVSGNMADLAWQWGDGSTNPWMEVSEPGGYHLAIDDGCEVQEFDIFVGWANERREGDFFFVPNSFSPNYDGVNDEFRVFPGLDFTIKSFELKVFDRWGDMLFSTPDVEQGWNGISRGVHKQPAVYVWYLKAKLELCGGREMDYFRKGDVVIIR